MGLLGMELDKSSVAEKDIFNTLLALKSVTFLEEESAKLLRKMDRLEVRRSLSRDYAERERLLAQIESHLPQLRVLKARCDVEYRNITNLSRRKIQ
jgi:hypothetical protein